MIWNQLIWVLKGDSTGSGEGITSVLPGPQSCSQRSGAVRRALPIETLTAANARPSNVRGETGEEEGDVKS